MSSENTRLAVLEAKVEGIATKLDGTQVLLTATNLSISTLTVQLQQSIGEHSRIYEALKTTGEQVEKLRISQASQRYLWPALVVAASLISFMGSRLIH